MSDMAHGEGGTAASKLVEDGLLKVAEPDTAFIGRLQVRAAEAIRLVGGLREKSAAERPFWSEVTIGYGACRLLAMALLCDRGLRIVHTDERSDPAIVEAMAELLDEALAQQFAHAWEVYAAADAVRLEPDSEHADEIIALAMALQSALPAMLTEHAGSAS